MRTKMESPKINNTESIKKYTWQKLYTHKNGVSKNYQNEQKVYVDF